METTIIKEIPVIEQSLKDVNNTVSNNPDNKKRNRDIDVAALMLVKNMTLLKNFLTDPVTSADDIIKKHGDLPYSKEFPDIFKAVNCEHTKEQGVTIGKSKIIAAIRKIADEIKSKYKDTSTIFRSTVDNIDEVSQLVNGSFDMVTQQRRYSQATENEYFTNYTKTNIDKYFVPESIEISSGLPLSKFLLCCLNVYNGKYLDTINAGITALSELDNDLSKKIAYFNANNKYMGTTQFNKTQIVYPEVDKKLLRYNNPSKNDCYIAAFMEANNELPIADEKVDKLEVLKTLVDGTETRKTEITTSLDKYRNVLSSLVNKDLNIPAVIDGLITAAIDPMVNVSITLDEYNLKLDEYTIVIHNLLSVYDKILTIAENTCNIPTNTYYIADRIYKLVDKVLIKSTMEKGQEKKASSVVYDTTPNNGVQ